MGEAVATTEASIHEIRASLDLLHGNLARIDTTQQQLMEQLGLLFDGVQESTRQHDEAARRLEALDHRVGSAVPTRDLSRGHPPSLEEDDADPGEHAPHGKTTLHPAHMTWTGNAPGASSTSSLPGSGDGQGDLEMDSRGDGILGGGRPGGVGGGVHGGAGGGRTHTGDQGTKHHLKMSFPRFDGTQPRIWRDKCLDYFKLFNVHPSLWLISTTLHMDGNATLWLKAYRLRHEVSSWTVLMAAVEEKFGADDHRKFMKHLMSLKQRGTVEEYQQQFEELSYQVAIQNPHYDEKFYMSQFIRGLKSELRAAVESQVPESVERAILLALVQKEILAEAKPWAQRQQLQPRPDLVVPRTDAPRQAVKLGTGDMWKDRQLRDYHRAHNLCFKCGEPFNPAHLCARKPAAELHALTTEETPEQLSDEVLNMPEMQDLAEA
jgi:hypothetical protein